MDIIPEPVWQFLEGRLMEENGTFLFLGDTDSGKTTLVRYLLASCISAKVPVAMVDADIGQSTVGPPGTISEKTFRSEVDLEDLHPDAMIFVGSLNPAEQPAVMIDGTKRLTDRARGGGSRTVLVDTTGLISGERGKALKIGKIRSIRPDLLIALQRHDELEHILTVVKDNPAIRIGISPHARARRREDRIRYREERFRQYFQEASLIEMPEQEAQFYYGTRSVDPREVCLRKGSLVGLNRSEDTLALGCIDHVASGTLAIITPLSDWRSINRLVFGDIILDKL